MNKRAGKIFNAPVRGLLSSDERHELPSVFRIGSDYIVEIVRPRGQESLKRWSFDEQRNICGEIRVVSRQQMRLMGKKEYSGYIELELIGRDRYGHKDDGIYRFYFTTPPIHKADTYILSVTRLYGRYEK